MSEEREELLRYFKQMSLDLTILSDLSLDFRQKREVVKKDCDGIVEHLAALRLSTSSCLDLLERKRNDWQHLPAFFTVHLSLEHLDTQALASLLLEMDLFGRQVGSLGRSRETWKEGEARIKVQVRVQQKLTTVVVHVCRLIQSMEQLICEIEVKEA